MRNKDELYKTISQWEWYIISGIHSIDDVD